MRRKTDDSKDLSPGDRLIQKQPTSRGLRLREGFALGVLAIIMACAWVVTLSV